MKISELKEQLRKDLTLLGDDEPEVIEESYAAQPKKYTLNTEALRSKTKQQHFELYDAYLQSLNQVSADLDRVDRTQANQNYSEFRDAKRSEVFNLNAVALHELYFANISDIYSEVNMDSLAYMRINRDFGTFDDWQRDFMACAMGARGWVVTVLSTYLQRYINIVIDSHDQGIPIGTYPLIVLDCFEHARRDYLNNKQAYVEAMMLELNWRVIEERFKRADAILEILK